LSASSAESGSSMSSRSASSATARASASRCACRRKLAGVRRAEVGEPNALERLGASATALLTPDAANLPAEARVRFDSLPRQQPEVLEDQGVSRRGPASGEPPTCTAPTLGIIIRRPAAAASTCRSRSGR